MSIINYSKSDLELMVGKDEEILWRGKPNKRGFIMEGVFNPLLPVALVWALFDSAFIFASQGNTVVLLFLLIHLMPVWMYLGGVLLIMRKYKHTEYIVTNKGVYISGGLFAYSCQMKPFTELARVNIHRGIIDQILGVGDIIMTSNNVADLYSRSNVRINGRPLEIGLAIEDIQNYQYVFSLIKKLQEDIYTDTMYPNDLRPEENHGYRTKYKGM